MKWNLISLMTKLDFVPEKRLMELYPPFLFMGVKVKKVSPDYRHLHLHLPLRWYGKNMHGSMFGGFICSVSDPMPVLMCLRLFPDAQAWTKSHLLEFLKPARGSLDLKIDIEDEAVERVRADLDRTGSAHYDFEYRLTDSRNRVVAKVTNSVYLRIKSGAESQKKKAS